MDFAKYPSSRFWEKEIPTLFCASVTNLSLIWVLVNFSAHIAIAPLVCPMIFSPIINSEVVVDGLVIENKTTVGADGSVVSNDS